MRDLQRYFRSVEQDLPRLDKMMRGGKSEFKISYIFQKQIRESFSHSNAIAH